MKKYFSFITLLLFAVTVFGQYDPRENFYDAEFFFAEEEYEEAFFSFKKVYDDGYQDNSNINYRIGSCLLRLDGRKTEAIPYLKKATEEVNEKYKIGNFKETGAPPEAYLLLGNAYRINYEYENATNSYKKFLEFFEDQDAHEHQLIYTKIQIEACQLAKDAVNKPVEYDAGTLGQLNEISAPIYNATLSGDLSTLAFMGKLKFYNAIYVSRKVDGKWIKPVNITPDIQSDGNQDVLALSFDGNKLLLSWSDEFDSEIWISEYSNDRWNRSKPFGKPVNSKYYESHASFSPDGNTIYFTSNRKESLGEMDIFKAVKNADGTWSEMMILGENINTHLNEESPFVSPDGKRLYFSSQGHETLGGFDIFYCEIMEDGTFGNPENLGYPLNTTDDDFGFMPLQTDYNGYLTLYANGDDEQVDLLRFELIPESAVPVIVAFIEEEVVEEEVVEEVVEQVKEEVKREKYTIKPVFFDFDSYKLSATATSKLDDIAMILNKFPGLIIEIKGHTDAIGANDYNQRLSDQRAKAVAKYLQENNISKERLVVKGFSESKPVAINKTSENKDSPDGRQLNRRVEFGVKVAGGDVLIEVAKVQVPDHLKIK